MKRFTQICERSMSYENAIKSLHKSELFMKIKIFVDDLMNFGNDENARKRLEKGDLFYMSDLHFTQMEKREILEFPTTNGRLFSEYLEFILKQKADSGHSEICASHNIAPVFLQVFGILKGFSDEKTFKTAKKERVRKEI